MEYQEYPRCIYHHEQRRSMVVNDDKEMKQQLRAGWRKDPPTEAPIVEVAGDTGMPPQMIMTPSVRDGSEDE